MSRWNLLFGFGGSIPGEKLSWSIEQRPVEEHIRRLPKIKQRWQIWQYVTYVLYLISLQKYDIKWRNNNDLLENWKMSIQYKIKWVANSHRHFPDFIYQLVSINLPSQKIGFLFARNSFATTILSGWCWLLTYQLLHPKAVVFPLFHIVVSTSTVINAYQWAVAISSHLKSTLRPKHSFPSR